MATTIATRQPVFERDRRRASAEPSPAMHGQPNEVCSIERQTQHEGYRRASAAPRAADKDAKPRSAQVGDIVTVDLDMQPENGYVPELLFDTTGKISFVLGWGNYLPGLHALVRGKAVGEAVSGVSIDAGYGSHDPRLVLRVPRSRFQKLDQDSALRRGATVHLQNGRLQVLVKDVTDDFVTVDANHPLAGSSFSCSFTVLNVQSMPDDRLVEAEVDTDADAETEPARSRNDTQRPRYRIATWAMGCFWGGELAFMRQPGVVGTRVGYTQGVTVDPTYEDVCRGTTQHREAVMVVYDETVVSYQQLLSLYMHRLSVTTSQYKIPIMPDEAHDDDGHPSQHQYRHGIYYHSESQRRQAQAVIDSNDNFYQVELKMAADFYRAEDYHQQYLLKGGQSGRKNAKETIRCFG